MDWSILAEVDTALNAITTVLLVLGWYWIKVRRDEQRHKRFMLAAAVTSALFLGCYLLYHWKVGSVPYQGQGAKRAFYFALLISHVVLAAVNVPLVITTLVLGWRDRREAHRRWARITFPIWLYVSVTGIAVYVMLHT